MITRLLSLSSGILGACFFVLIVTAPCQILAAGETVYQVQLIWGTNGDKPKDKALKEVDPQLQKKLKGVFKWKNYFEVNKKALSVPKETAQRLTLSDKCDIEVEDLGSSRAEVRLFGEGTLVLKKAQTVVPGEMIVVAGNSKDDTAWFVVLTPSK